METIIINYRVGEKKFFSYNRKIEKKKQIETYKGCTIYSITIDAYELGYNYHGNMVVHESPVRYAHYDLITVEREGKQIFRSSKCDIKKVRLFISRYINKKSRIKKEIFQLKMF